MSFPDGSKQITLHPVGMMKVSKQKIHSIIPEHIEPPITISEAQFIQKYADTAQSLKVTFTDNLNDWKQVTVYGIGFNYWYVKADDLHKSPKTDELVPEIHGI